MLISLTGPSGVGKGYLSRALICNFPQIKQVVWSTTRPLRPGEEDGVRRHLSEHEFFEKVEKGEIILAQELYGNHYGLERVANGFVEGVWLTELQASNLPPAISLGLPVYPIAIIPNDCVFLRERLEKYRGTESDSEIAVRLELAESEIAWIKANASIFRHVIEVTRSNEGEVVSGVIHMLEAVITGGDRNGPQL